MSAKNVARLEICLGMFIIAYATHVDLCHSHHAFLFHKIILLYGIIGLLCGNYLYFEEHFRDDYMVRNTIGYALWATMVCGFVALWMRVIVECLLHL